MDTTPFRTPLRPASAASQPVHRSLHPNFSEHSFTPSRSSPLAAPSQYPALVTPNHSTSRYATSAFPSPTPSGSSSSSSSSSLSTTQPILIPTPKLGRFLRPLRAKLAHFRQVASSAPQAHRELVEPPTPSHRPLPRRSAASTSFQSTASPNTPAAPVAVTYALRKSTRSSSSSSAPLAQPAAAFIPIPHLLSSVTAFLGASRRVPAPSTRIPTPLRPSIASIQDAYKDVVHKTWRQTGQQGVLGQQQPLSLVDLAAFKLGDLIACQCEDEEDAVDELEGVYADLPVHIRSRVLLQHATRLCIASAREPSILLGLTQTAFNSATRDQFVPLATAAIAGDPSRVSLDVLASIITLAAKCGRLEPVLVTFIDALTVTHVQRNTLVQFARWAAGCTELAVEGSGARWDVAVPGMVAAKMVQVVLRAESAVSDAVIGHLIEYAKVFVGVAARVFAAEAEAVKSAEDGEVAEVMPSVWAEQMVALADALSSADSTRVPDAITYPISVALLTLASSSPTRGLSHIPAQLAACLPALPRRASTSVIDDDADSDSDSSPISRHSDNLLVILYQATQPNFWLEAALALYSAPNSHAHALAVARYLLADMQDGDARCALEPRELAAWTRVIEMEMVEAELATGCGKVNGVQRSKRRSEEDVHEDQTSSTDAQSAADKGYGDAIESTRPARPTPSAADSLPPTTPFRLPPPPVLTPTPARTCLPTDHAPWYLTPVSTHSRLTLAAEVPEPTPCVAQANLRSSRRTRTSSAASENQHPDLSRTVRNCRKRSRSQQQDQSPASGKGPRSRKSARTRTRITVSVQISSSEDEEDDDQADELTSGASVGRGTRVSRVEIVDPLSETDEPDEFLMM